MRRFPILALALALIASTCANDAPAPGGESAGPDTSSSAPQSTTNTPKPVAPAGEWETVRPTFEVDGFSESVEGNRADIAIIESAAGAYWAAGDINGHPTLWRSDDLTAFEVVYHHDWTPSARWIHFTTIAGFDGKVIVGGTGRVSDGSLGDDPERSFLLSTTDDGATWVDHEFDWLTGEFQRLDRLVPVGDALLVDLVNDECCEQPRWTPRRTTDLVTWEPIVLPDANTDTWGSFLSDESGTAWVIARDWVNDTPVLELWESTDAGGSWRPQESAEIDLGSYAAIDGTIFFAPDAGRSGFAPDHPTVVGPWRFAAGAWSELPSDVGQWGDGRAHVSGSVNDDGRLYGLASRTTRASAHYCYDDIDSCQIPEVTLVTTLDGIDWFDIVGPELDLAGSPTLMLTPDGRPLLSNAIEDRDEGDDRRHEFTVWTGSEPPLTRNPDGYDPPAIPVPMIDSGDVLEIGGERRYIWGLGFCGGMFFDGTDWLPSEPPDTAGWPILPFFGFDGPTGWALGRVLRVAEDHIQFWIEGDAVRYDFHPRVVEPEVFCG